MKRITTLFLAASLVLISLNAFAQKKPPAGKTPAKQAPLMLDLTYKGTKYILIPYEVVYPKSHADLQEMFPDKYQIFWVVVDNRRGNADVTFDPKSGDATVYTQKGDRKTPVDLSNTFKDPEAAKKISKAFKEAYIPISVPKGEMKSTIVVFSPFNLLDIRSAAWSIVGEEPKPMKRKPLTRADQTHYKLEPIGEAPKEKEKK